MSFRRINLLARTLCRHTAVELRQHGRHISTTAVAAKSFRKMYRDFWTPQPRSVPPYEHFTQVGDPVLRDRAANVPADLITSPEVDAIAQQMVKVLHKFNCVGIAAPQVGVSLRIIAIEFGEHLKDRYAKAVYEARKMSTMPLTIVINPTLKVTNYEKHKHEEGCMSVRGFSAVVERYESVTLTGVDLKGNAVQLDLNGWNARIAQHEMDHLDGKLYIDKMDTSTFHCTCWQAVNSKAGRIEIPFYK